MLTLKVTISALCALGLYASVFMYRKALADQAGKLAGRSVVQRPAARLFFGTPNSLFGIAYYTALGIGIWFVTGWGWVPLLLASCAAALTSFYLAYSLLFRTRMPCPYCWTSHLTNWVLAALVIVAAKFT